MVPMPFACKKTRMRIAVSALCAAIPLSVALADNHAVLSPYTVEDALRREQISSLQFDRSGRRLLVARLIPDAAASRFSWSLDAHFTGIHRSALFVLDLEHNAGLQRLFRSNERDGYKPLSISPDGRYLAYVHAHQDEMTAGIYELQSGRSREFDFTPAAYGLAPAWISDEELVFSATSSARLPSAYTSRIARAWESMSTGQAATASAVGSGHYAAKWTEDDEQGVVVANAARGVVRRLGRGLFFSHYAVSPDRSWLAAARSIPKALDPDVPLEQDGYQRRQLVLFGLKAEDIEIEVCASCDVSITDSLGWSASGRLLAFSTSNGGSPHPSRQLWIYDVARRSAQLLDVGSLTLINPAGASPAFVWLGEQLVAPARLEFEQRKNRTATGWFVVSGAPPVNLMASFGNKSVDVIGKTPDSLLVLADGEIWSIAASGVRRRLTGKIKGDVRVCRQRATPEGGVTAYPTSTLVLEATAADRKSRVVYFLDVDSGKMTPVQAPTADAQVMTVSIQTRRVVFRYVRNNTEIFTVTEHDRPNREIVRLNSYFRDVVAGTPVRIAHKGPRAEELTSWILLPPGYRGGQTLPTVVEVYPGIVNSLEPGELRFGTEGDPMAAMEQLLAAHGYAVLVPSIPINDEEFPRETLQGITEATLAAVDAAAAAGYVDVERMAIQGTSFGAYATAGVIGQTHRFKAAIATAGIYDLLSHYGVSRLGKRLEAEFEGLDMGVPAGWAETGGHFGGALGAPPWRDPQRYLRNSPLLKVEDINTPILLFHGDLDSTVSFTQAEELFTALYRLNKDAVFVRYWGEGHRVAASPANIRDYYKRVFDWYDEHIGPAFPVHDALRHLR